MTITEEAWGSQPFEVSYANGHLDAVERTIHQFQPTLKELRAMVDRLESEGYTGIAS